MKTEFLDHRLQLNGSRVPDGLGGRAVRSVLQPDDPRQHDLRRQRPGLPRSRASSCSWWRGSPRGSPCRVRAPGTAANQTSSPCLIANDPGSPNLGQCITESQRESPFPNPFGAVDTRAGVLAAARSSTCARATTGHRRLQSLCDVRRAIISGPCRTSRRATWTATRSRPSPTPRSLRYDQPGYTTYDAAIGVSKDNWSAEVISAQNLSNSDASVFTSSAQFIKSEVPLRPRVLGVKIGFKF